MPASLTTVDAILKEIYENRIVDQLRTEAIGFRRIEATSDGVVETVGGKYVDFPIRVSRNHGIGYRNENEQLPASGNQGYAEVHVPLKYGYARVRFTGQMMKLAEKNHQAFASAMDREMEGAKDDTAWDQNRIFYGDGTGLLASFTAAATGTTHTVDNNRLIEPEMLVDVLVRSDGSTVSLNNRVVSTSGTTSVTFATSFTAATTHGMYRQGSRNREPTGLATIVHDTATLHGLAPSAQPKWAGIRKGNAGVNRALSEGLMIETCDDVRKNGGKVSLILGDLGVRRAYFNLLTQQRRYTDTKQFAGGFTGLAFNYGTEVPMVEDPDAPPNKMWFLTEDRFKIYQQQDWHWADDDGTILKWVTDYDAWEALLRKYFEIGNHQRNAQAVLEDITSG